MLVLFIFVLAGIACANVQRFYTDSEYVQEITEVEQFRELYNSPHIVVMEFYAHWCGHCKEFSSDYEKAAKHLQNQMVFAAVNCDHQDKSNEQAMSICGHFKVQSLPTVLMIRPRDLEEKLDETGTKRQIKVPIIYDGKRSAAGVVKWANSKVEKEIVTRLDNIQTFKKLLSTGPAEIARFVVFGEKPTISNKLLYIAQSIRPDFPIGNVGIVAYSNQKSLAEEIGLTTFPCIARFVNAEAKPDRVYTGDMTFEAMQEWIQENAEKFDANKYAEERAERQAKQNKPATPKKERIPELYTVESEAQWEQACPKSMRGLCFLAFLNPSDEAHKGFIDVLNQFFPAHPELQVVYVNREMLPQFSSAFNIGEMNPQIALFQRGSLRVKNFFGGFELGQIEEFIKHAFSGKRIFTLDADPVLDQPAKSEL